MWTLQEQTRVGVQLAPLLYAAAPAILSPWLDRASSTEYIFGTVGLIATIILAQMVGATEPFQLKVSLFAGPFCHALGGARILPLSTILYAYWVSFFMRSFFVNASTLYRLPILVTGIALGTFDCLWKLRTNCARSRELAAAILLASACGVGWNYVVESEVTRQCKTAKR